MPTDAPDGTHARTQNTSTNMSVQEYIEKHDLTKKIEEALNAAVKAKAEEPLAFVVRTFFSRSSSPSSRARHGARRAVDPSTRLRLDRARERRGNATM